MRGLTSFVLAALVIGSLASVSRAEDPVYFADPNLQAAVEAELGVPNPTPTDMLALTSLSADSSGIVDLIGLEHATNLAGLQLAMNQIMDISAFSGLTNLTYLTLYVNQISDVSVLASLTNLKHLDLAYNQISDISALAGLTNLTVLNLYSNQISDISALASLTNLEHVNLGGNQISDISALAGLTSFAYLNFHPNSSLNAEAYTTYIPLIIANNPGIEIYYDPYGTAPVYRFWSPVYERHFYTTKESEKDKLLDNYAHVWTYEGIAYWAYGEPYDVNLAPVYRFWSPALTSHFYTISETERDKLINQYAHVWTDEGISWYAFEWFGPHGPPGGGGR